jgi:hypothetical protein
MQLRTNNTRATDDGFVDITTINMPAPPVHVEAGHPRVTLGPVAARSSNHV